MKNLLGIIPAAGLLLMISFFVAIIFWATANDFAMFQAYTVTETLYNDSIIDNATYTQASGIAERYYGIIEFFDIYFLAGVLLFFFGTIAVSYFAPPLSDPEFFTYLFLGIMLALVSLSIIGIFTDWFQTNFLYNLFPNLEGSFTGYDFYYEYIGFISFVQMLLCLAANKVDFGNLRRKSGNKGIEVQEELL